jgi:hypothetical protein
VAALDERRAGPKPGERAGRIVRVAQAAYRLAEQRLNLVQVRSDERGARDEVVAFAVR